MPSFIIEVLFGLSLPICEQPWKSPSWIWLNLFLIELILRCLTTILCWLVTLRFLRLLRFLFSISLVHWSVALESDLKLGASLKFQYMFYHFHQHLSYQLSKLELQWLLLLMVFDLTSRYILTLHNVLLKIYWRVKWGILF